VDIALLIESLRNQKDVAWFRLEVTNGAAQEFFGYEKPCWAAVSFKSLRGKLIEGWGNTPLEALVELNTLVEALSHTQGSGGTEKTGV